MCHRVIVIRFGKHIAREETSVTKTTLRFLKNLSLEIQICVSTHIQTEQLNKKVSLSSRTK